MSLLNHIHDFLAEQFDASDRFVVGVSGGMDSMVLADILLQLPFSFSIAHVNYQLRGEESNGDEDFVVQWAKQNQIHSHVLKVQKESIPENTQNWARKIRREHFENCLKEQNAKCILLAQHLNDQWETQWLQWLRGSVNGLGGIKKIDVPYCRPLLDIPKKEIEQYAQQRSLTWREDSSNAKDDYSRNYLRHQILPNVKERFEISDEQIKDHSEKLQEHQDWWNFFLKNWIDENLIHEPFSTTLPFHSIPTHLSASTILYHWLSPYGFSSKDIEAILEIKHSQNGSLRRSPQAVVTKTDMGWSLSIIHPNIPSSIPIAEPNCTVNWDGIKVECRSFQKSSPFEVVKKANFLQMDISKIQFPLTLRIWNNGDKIQPLGMSGTMLLSDYYTQKKIHTSIRNKFPVIADQNKIIGVLGLGIAQSVKITETTESIIQIQHLPLPSSLPFE